MAKKRDKLSTLVLLLLLLLVCVHHPSDGEPNQNPTTSSSPSGQPSDGVDVTSPNQPMLGTSVTPPLLTTGDTDPGTPMKLKSLVTLENIPNHTKIPNIVTPSTLRELPGLFPKAPAKTTSSQAVTPTDQGHTDSLSSLTDAVPDSLMEDQFFNSPHAGSARKEGSEGTPAGRQWSQNQVTTAATAGFISNSFSNPNYLFDSTSNYTSFITSTSFPLHKDVDSQPQHFGFGNPVNKTLMAEEKVIPDEESKLKWTAPNHSDLPVMRLAPSWSMRGRDYFMSRFQARCDKKRQQRRQGQQERCDGTEWNMVTGAELCHYCMPCGCKEHCYKNDSCCMDTIISDSTTGCLNSFLTPRPEPRRFTMVDRCPSTWENDHMSDTCSNISSEDIDDRWPMWSPVTGLTYRNVHCGRCHGQEPDQLQPWDLTVFCPYTVNLEAFRSVQDALIQMQKLPDCALGFNPPKGSSSQRCREEQDRADLEQAICPLNSTVQNLTMYGWYLQVCEVFSGVEPTMHSLSVPLDLVCALCWLGNWGSMCKTPIDTPFPFVMVLSSRALRDVTSEAGGESCGCASDEIYDSFESRCRKLHCSPARRVVDYVCVPIVKTLKGTGYELNLRLTPDIHPPITIESTSYLDDYALVTYDAFKRQIAVNWFQTYVFQVVFRTESNSSSEISTDGNMTLKEMDVKIKMKLKDLTDIEEVDEILLGLTAAPWNFTVTGKLQDGALYQVVPLFRGQNKAKHYHEEARYMKPGLEQIFSNETVADYAVHVHKIIPLSVAEYSIEYNPVQYTLNCTKVSFNLTTSSQTESFRDYTNPLLDRSRDRTERELRFRHSLHEDSGEVLLSVDRETGDVFHVPSERTVTFQYVQLQEEKNIVLVCADQLYDRRILAPASPLVLEKFFSSKMIYISVVCQSLSVLCLLLVLLTFCLFAELRTLPGKNTMGLVISLLITMLLFQLGVSRVEIRAVCVALGVAIHFSLLSTFTWMGLCSFHMYRLFAHALTIRHLSQPQSQSSLFYKHTLFSVLLPACIVVATVLGNLAAQQGRDPEGCEAEEPDWGYGRGICYVSNVPSLILASVVPICVVVVVNAVLFLLTVAALRHLGHDARKATQQQCQQLALYFRMSTLTGINWLAGVAIVIVDYVAIWYIFLVLGGLQGLYIFIAFVCNQRVLSLYQALLGCKKKGRSESVPEMPDTETT